MGITKRASRRMEQVPQLNCNPSECSWTNVQLFGWKFRRRTRAAGIEPKRCWALVRRESPPTVPPAGTVPIRLQIHAEWQARKWSPSVGAQRLGRHTAA
jgi:hypothetical protein